MPWLLSYSKWLGTYSHRREVHILTIFHSSKKIIPMQFGPAIWSPSGIRFFFNDRVERLPIPIKVFRISYVLLTPATNWRWEKTLQIQTLGSEWELALPFRKKHWTWHYQALDSFKHPLFVKQCNSPLENWFWAGRTEKNVKRGPWPQFSTKKPCGMITPTEFVNFDLSGKPRLLCAWSLGQLVGAKAGPDEDLCLRQRGFSEYAVFHLQRFTMENCVPETSSIRCSGGGEAQT